MRDFGAVGITSYHEKKDEMMDWIKVREIKNEMHCKFWHKKYEDYAAQDKKYQKKVKKLAKLDSKMQDKYSHI